MREHSETSVMYLMIFEQDTCKKQKVQVFVSGFYVQLLNIMVEDEKILKLQEEIYTKVKTT